MSVRKGRAVWSAGAVYAVSAAVCCALAARSQAHFVDLQVYRMGGAAVLHGGRLYQLRLVWLPFTYPPFAAVVFAALAVVPWKVAVTVLTGASVAALQAHAKAPHMDEYRTRVKDLVKKVTLQVLQPA